MLVSIKNAARGLGEKIRGGDDFGGPSRQDNRARDYAVIGGAAGVVAGATIGTIKGFHSQANNGVEEVSATKNIVHPELTGYDHHTRVDRDRYCVEREGLKCVDYETKTEGWWHTYSPDIKNRVVGTYAEPQFKNTNFFEPLSGALIGGVVGGLIGVAGGLGLAALTKSLGKDAETVERVEISEQVKSRALKETGDEDAGGALETRMGAYAIAGTAVGAGVGIYLGIQAGAAESAANQVNTRAWQVPVYRDDTIGHIPDGFYEHKGFLQWRPGDGDGRPENVPVREKVPVYNDDGSVKMQTVEETFNSKRYGRVVGGLAGGVIGAGVGLAAGVTVGLADKLITQSLAKEK